MHCPKVLARTAMPVSTMATFRTPGIARISRLLRSRLGVPLSVGGRQTIVGSAPGTWRSIAKSFCPVTARRASSRLRGWPMTEKSVAALSSTWTGRSVALAALLASSPYDTELPSGAVMMPSWLRSRATSAPSWMAAASRSAPLAIAAATRTGVYVETVVFEPPVSWFQTSSGRAGASVTTTFSTGTSSSSAMSIAVEVVIPWPTSIRGSAKEAVPSSLMVTVIRFAVGWAASVCRSSRS